jgi:hypothetical protein
MDHLLELEDLDVGVTFLLNESNLVYTGDNIYKVDEVPVVKMARGAVILNVYFDKVERLGRYLVYYLREPIRSLCQGVGLTEVMAGF